MSTAPTAARLIEPAECIIEVDGVEISPFYRYLRQVEVQMTRADAATCSLVFDDVRAEGGAWTTQDIEIFRPWKKLAISANFGSYRQPVLNGYIREVKLDFPEDPSGVSVTVLGQDETLLLDREYIRGSYASEQSTMTDREIIQQLIADSNLQLEAAEGLSNVALNVDGTVVTFIRDRARANGYEFLVRNNTLYFGPPRLSGAPQPTIMVYAGRASNCLRFSTRFDGHKPDKIQMLRASARGTGIDDQILESKLDLLGARPATSEHMGLRPFVWNLRSPNGATAAEATARAQASADENAWKLIGEGELDGAQYGHVLLTHETVRVDGIGDTYGGVYYVDQVTHAFTLDGYIQSFKLLRNAIGDQADSRNDTLAKVRT
jgi:phage protein D